MTYSQVVQLLSNQLVPQQHASIQLEDGTGVGGPLMPMMHPMLGSNLVLNSEGGQATPTNLMDHHHLRANFNNDIASIQVYQPQPNEHDEGQ